jgi:hypothetical protein
MYKRIFKKVSDVIRKEAPAAGPAARDAAVRGATEFAQEFWKRYQENRRKR